MHFINWSYLKWLLYYANVKAVSEYQARKWKPLTIWIFNVWMELIYPSNWSYPSKYHAIYSTRKSSFSSPQSRSLVHTMSLVCSCIFITKVSPTERICSLLCLFSNSQIRKKQQCRNILLPHTNYCYFNMRSSAGFYRVVVEHLVDGLIWNIIWVDI